MAIEYLAQSINQSSEPGSLFTPRTVALVGASSRPGSYGRALFDMCTGCGFSRPVYLVNPNYQQIDNQPVYPNLSALPELPELVVISVANDRVYEAAKEALACGAKALVVFAEMPDAAQRHKLTTLVRKAGTIMCGPNSMGLHNICSGLRLTPFPAPTDLIAGGIGLVVQSGSIMGALVHNDRRLRFSHVVSTGSETITTAADYLYWMASRPETRCIGLFLETVRNPARFIAAMELAAQRNIPVVIMKVGRSAQGATMAITHTGALVGNDSIFRALVKRLGGHMADTVDALAAQLMLFSQGRTVPQGNVASIHDSGGERELLADLMEDLGLSFAELSEHTHQQIATVVEPSVKVENPLDAWATGLNAEHCYREAMTAMMNDPNVAVGLYVLDWRQDYYLHEMHERCLIAAAAATDKPIAAVSNYSLTHNAALASRLADHNIPLLEGTQEALIAVLALLSQRSVSPFRTEKALSPPAAKWQQRLSQHDWLGEVQGYELLQDYGINTVNFGLANSRQQALELFEAFGEVAIKTTAPGIAHKTDVGGVVLGIKTTDELMQVYDDLSARLGAETLIAQMTQGSEWSLGVIIDPDFGPAVRIAPGGILIELMQEQALLMAPFSETEALEAVSSLKAAQLLSGYRGSPEYCMPSLCQAAANLSRLAWELADCIGEIEINPIFVQLYRAVAADVLISRVGQE